jgi:hypothetical protein
MRTSPLITLCVSLGIAAATPAVHADRAPSSRDTRQVVEYYYSDAEQPVLMDFGLCRGIHNEGPDRYECREPLSESELTAGMRVYAWMKFLVPRGATPSIMLRIDHDARTRDTWTRRLEGAVRFRTWHAVDLDRPGRWRMEVFHANGGDPLRLFSRTVRID